jgi:hypothetical protein
LRLAAQSLEHILAFLAAIRGPIAFMKAWRKTRVK